jgi:hypothetical protein
MDTLSIQFMKFLPMLNYGLASRSLSANGAVADPSRGGPAGTGSNGGRQGFPVPKTKYVTKFLILGILSYIICKKSTYFVRAGPRSEQPFNGSGKTKTGSPEGLFSAGIRFQPSHKPYII